MKKMMFLAVLAPLMWSGCVSKKKYNEQVEQYKRLSEVHEKLAKELDNCEVQNDQRKKRIIELEDELRALKANANAMLNQLSDLSVITKEQAASINKSIDLINTKDSYIGDLQRAINRKDSLNMALILNLKQALVDVNDTDIEIKVEGSAVFVSISDKLLFKSGSYELSASAKQVLGKVAAVLKAQPDIQFMVEGHTDNKPIKTQFIKDNWDLSVLRATAVVRSLQKDFALAPLRMTAAGKGEYQPVLDNNSEANRAANRRTRIVILPQLDQFFKLLEPKG
jgi:chemotaxis protein MotB